MQVTAHARTYLHKATCPDMMENRAIQRCGRAEREGRKKRMNAKVERVRELGHQQNWQGGYG
eukprot:828296-Pleurochrysis_carterae.AAC.5